jgi:hypothetical protein
MWILHLPGDLREEWWAKEIVPVGRFGVTLFRHRTVALIGRLDIVVTSRTSSEFGKYNQGNQIIIQSFQDEHLASNRSSRLLAS